jgi:hypothetical protein
MSGPQNVTVSVTTPAPVTITSTSTQGPRGPPGRSGASVTYVFTQASPSALWTIAHNLDNYPSVTVTDSTEREVEGDVQYQDANTLTVGFSAPFSGVAYLN